MKQFVRTIEWIALAAGVIAGLLLFVAVLRVVWASARLERKIATLRLTGEPATLADLVRAPISPESNAATHLARARADVESIQSQMLGVDTEVDRVGFYEGGTSPAIEAAIRQALAAYPRAVPLLLEASNCPDYDPQFDFTSDAQTFTKDLLAHTQYWRAVIRVLNFQARLQLAEGHGEDALKTCVAMFRLARQFDRNPTLVSQLVAIAARGTTVGTANLVLRAGRLDRSAHHDLESELARHDMTEAYREALRSERAFGLLSFQDMVSQMGFGARWRPSLNDDQCDYLDVMAEYLEGAGSPYVDSAGSPKTRGTLTQLTLPAIEAQRGAFARVQAELGSLRVLNALVENEQAADSATPALEELGLPSEAITDPYTGNLLHVRKLPRGWLVYSVGQNLTDDGGKLADREDVGLGPIEPAAGEK